MPPHEKPVGETNRGLPFVDMSFRDALLFALPVLGVLLAIYLYQWKQFRDKRARVNALYGLKKKDKKDE